MTESEQALIAELKELVSDMGNYRFIESLDRYLTLLELQREKARFIRKELDR